MGNDPQATRQSRQALAAAVSERQPTVCQEREESPIGTAETVGSAVARALLPLLTRDDGWLRVSPADDGETVYFKWKWTRGPYANHYVMTVHPHHEADQALAGLARKVDSVDRGKKRPVKDHYFH